MRKRTTAQAGALMLGLTGMLLAPAQVSAQEWTIHDRHDPGRQVQDISRVTVDHGPRNVRVRTGFWPRVNWVNVMEVWIDTRARNPGPEFRVSWNDLWPRSVGIHRVDAWRGDSSDRACPRATVKGKRGKDMVVKIPRRCLKVNGRLPARVRVVVHTYDEQFMRATQDWAPRKERFGRHFVRSS